MNYVVCLMKFFQFGIEKFHVDCFKIFFWLNIRSSDGRICLINHVSRKHMNMIITMFWMFFFDKLIEEFDKFSISILFFVFDIFEIADVFEIKIDDFVKYENWKKIEFFFFLMWSKIKYVFFSFVCFCEKSNDSKNEINKTKFKKIFNFWIRNFEIFKINFFERTRSLNKFNNRSRFQILIFFCCCKKVLNFNLINFTISKFFDDKQLFAFEKFLTKKKSFVDKTSKNEMNEKKIMKKMTIRQKNAK